MIPVLYNKSQKIKDNLLEFDSLKKSVISIGLDTATQIRLLFEGKAAKTFYALSLSSAPFSRSDVVETLIKPDARKKDSGDIYKYLKGLSQIKNWKLKPKEFTVSDCIGLYKESCFGQLKNDEEGSLKHVLGYVQVSREHPIIKAALAYILCFKINPFTQNSKRFAHLLFELFLIKDGADINGYFCIDHYFSDHKKEFGEILDYAYRTDNLTNWLEYVTKSAIEQMHFVRDVIQNRSSLFRSGISKRYFTLTRRQQELASISIIPNVRISNKKIQELFKVSQITASRDLSKLAILGLLEQHGKGRSVFYT